MSVKVGLCLKNVGALKMLERNSIVLCLFRTLTLLGLCVDRLLDRNGHVT